MSPGREQKYVVVWFIQTGKVRAHPPPQTAISPGSRRLQTPFKITMVLPGLRG